MLALLNDSSNDVSLKNSNLLFIFVKIQLPVLPNSPLSSFREKEIMGDLQLRRNLKLNFIENALFNNKLIKYDANYQNSQSHSKFFQEHMLNVYNIIKNSFSASSKIIEIGCGKGEFFEIMEKDNYFELEGYDVTYEGSNPKIHKRYIDENDKIQCDLIILRHTLEHIQRPHIFLKLLRKVFKESYIYIEVPEMNWIIENSAFYDITYEHVNYFNKESLTNLFDNKYKKWSKIFENQYQFIITQLSDLSNNFELEYNSKNWENLIFTDQFPELDKTISLINDNLGSKGKLYIWGSATKGAMFLIHCKSNKDLFSKIGFAIDINKNKIGKFLPVSKIEIKNKEDFYKSVQSDDLLLISNPNYVDEIKEDIIKNTNIKFKIQSL